jgi:uncharacterized membrane protein YidH (DUF202 family)
MSAPYHISVFKPAAATTLNFKVLAGKLGDIANLVIPFLIAIAFFSILWGIFRYIRSAGDEEKVAEGRRVVIWGVVALFLMFSFWGLVLLVKRSIFG